jgi:hypothetical protein
MTSTVQKKNRVNTLWRRLKAAVLIPFFMGVILMPAAASAKVDWEVSGAIQLEATPLAVVRTQEGDLTFVLTDKAQVVIYSDEGKLAGTVPVDPSVTDIAVSPKGEELYLINSKRKTLQTVSVNFIVEINTAGSPFLGPAGAEVAVVVFSDFQ